MSDTIRAFVAAELPDPIVSFLKKIQKDLGSYGFNVRWVKPENIHLTLKFLGDIPADNVEKIGTAIAEAAKETAPVSLSAKGIGTFPGIKRPRVIWAGLTGQQNELSALHKRLEHRLGTVGFEKEKRPFKAHLTLGRVKHKMNPRRLVEAMDEFGGCKSEPFMVDEIVLFKSDLKPTGAVYTKLSSIVLE